MDTSLVYFWSSEGFPDFIESRKLCWHGWGPRICFPFLDHSALLDSQGTEVAQGKKNIFLLQKETRENWWMLLWSSKSNNASSSVCSCHIQGTSHERRRGKTFSDVSQWLRTPQQFGECTNTSMAQGLRGTGLKKPSRPIIVTAQMEEVAAGYVYSDHQRAQRMRLSIKERMLWVKRKKEYESRLWRMTLKNQIWLTCKLPMNHHTTHSPGLSVWRWALWSPLQQALPDDLCVFRSVNSAPLWPTAQLPWRLHRAVRNLTDTCPVNRTTLETTGMHT